jgi:hypothetical protein
VQNLVIGVVYSADFGYCCGLQCRIWLWLWSTVQTFVIAVVYIAEFGYAVVYRAEFNYALWAKV